MLSGLKKASYANQIIRGLGGWIGAFMPSNEFILQTLVLAVVAAGFLTVAVRTWFADTAHYDAVRRRTKSALNAATGVIGHDGCEDSDATVAHGMAIKYSDGRRVIVRNGKIARDSVSSC